MSDRKIKLIAVLKRPGLYEVGGVLFIAETPEEAIRKYCRRKV